LLPPALANIATAIRPSWPTRLPLKLAGPEGYGAHEPASEADMGMEKFLQHQVPLQRPDAGLRVLVATIRALKMHGADRRWWPANRSPTNYTARIWTARERLSNLVAPHRNGTQLRCARGRRLEQFKDDTDQKSSWCAKIAIASGASIP